MLNTLGIVQVDHSLSPATSHLGRVLRGKTVLEWVIRRATDCQRLDAVVVALANQPQQRRWAGLVPPDVPVHYCEAGDALGECVEVLRHYPARAIVRIQAHSPFVDPVLIDRLVNTADVRVGCDYLGYGSREESPHTMAAMGLFAEWCRSDALRRADCEAHTVADRQQVTRYIYSRSEEFGVKLLSLPPELERDDVRRKLDCAENWEMTQSIFDALGPDEWDWRRLAGFVSQPMPHFISMAALDRSSSM